MSAIREDTARWTLAAIVRTAEAAPSSPLREYVLSLAKDLDLSDEAPRA